MSYDKSRSQNSNYDKNKSHDSRGRTNVRRRNHNGRSNYRIGMVTGQCWTCKQRYISCARLESGKFVCKDCDPVTYGEVARIEKERWINGK